MNPRRNFSSFWIGVLAVFLVVNALRPLSAQAACVERPYEATLVPSSRASLALASIGQGVVETRAGAWVLQLSEDEVDRLQAAGLNFKSIQWRGDTPPRGTYHDSTETKELLEQWAAAYPDILQVTTIGESAGGRPIMLAKLSDNAATREAEPSVLFDGAIHGNENIATELILSFLEKLLTGYGTDPDLTQIVDDFEIYLVPAVNPDGLDAGKRRNGNNVDLNRDHPFFWELGWTGRPTYASQPETQAMTDLALDYNFTVGISYHSGAVLFNYLWDTLPSGPHDTPDVEEIESLASGYADRADMNSIEGYDWYESHGTGEETYYGCNGTFGGIVELSYGQPPPSGQIEAIADENTDAMLWYLQQAQYGATGVVTDAVTGESVAAMILTSSALWPAYADPIVGRYHKMLPQGIVDVGAVAAGYQPATPVTMNQNPNGASTIDFELEPAGAFEGSAYKVVAVNMADPNNAHNNFSLPYMALGSADGVPFYMGKGGFIVFDMGERTTIDNVSGDDFTVVQAAVATADEGYSVQVSTDWTGPWTTIGSGSGTQSFDITSAGINPVRYVRINDDDDGNADAADAGFDLDAVTFSRACATPQFDFNGAPRSGPAPLTVAFVPTFTGLPGCVTAVDWDFGDGDDSSVGRAEHTYTEPGVYDVSLTATGPGGQDTVSKTSFIVVDGEGDDDTTDDDFDDDSVDDDVDDDIDDDDDTAGDDADGDDDSASDDDDDDSSGGGCGC